MNRRRRTEPAAFQLSSGQARPEAGLPEEARRRPSSVLPRPAGGRLPSAFPSRRRRRAFPAMISEERRFLRRWRERRSAARSAGAPSPSREGRGGRAGAPRPHVARRGCEGAIAVAAAPLLPRGRPSFIHVTKTEAGRESALPSGIGGRERAAQTHRARDRRQRDLSKQISLGLFEHHDPPSAFRERVARRRSRTRPASPRRSGPLRARTRNVQPRAAGDAPGPSRAG